MGPDHGTERPSHFICNFYFRIDPMSDKELAEQGSRGRGIKLTEPPQGIPAEIPVVPPDNQ